MNCLSQLERIGKLKRVKDEWHRYFLSKFDSNNIWIWFKVQVFFNKYCINKTQHLANNAYQSMICNCIHFCLSSNHLSLTISLKTLIHVVKRPWNLKHVALVCTDDNFHLTRQNCLKSASYHITENFIVHVFINATFVWGLIVPSVLRMRKVFWLIVCLRLFIKS